MGMGDVKLAAVMGLFLGRAVVPAIFAALRRRHRRRRDRDRALRAPRRAARRASRSARGSRFGSLVGLFAGDDDRRLVPRHLHVEGASRPRAKAPPGSRRPTVVPIPGAMRAVNLLPPDTRGASKVSAELGAGPEAKGGAGPFVVLGVLAACVAGAAGYVLTDNTVKQRKADLAEVDASSRRSLARPPQLKPYADFDAMAQARVATVKDIAGSRFDWEQVAARPLPRHPRRRHAEVARPATRPTAPAAPAARRARCAARSTLRRSRSRAARRARPRSPA